MKVIYKYPISIDEKTKLDMPRRSVFLSLRPDTVGKLCAWYLIDESDTKMVLRTIQPTMTGEEFNHSKYLFLGTKVFGSLVIHFFDITPV